MTRDEAEEHYMAAVTGVGRQPTPGEGAIAFLILSQEEEQAEEEGKSDGNQD